MSTLSAAILLFLVMDPIGNVPICMSLLKDVDRARWPRILLREQLIALGVLFAFLFGGEFILELLQIKSETVSMAGGIILFIIGLRMIFPTDRGIFGNDASDEPFIVPLAIPLIAGPSTIAAVTLLANSHPGRTVDWSLALMTAWGAGAVILMGSARLAHLLGQSLLTALARLMGMLLLALSVQMFLDGAVAYIHTHDQPPASAAQPAEPGEQNPAPPG